MSDHREDATRLAGARIADEVLAPSVRVLGHASDQMAESEGGRELLSLLVACALPASVTLVSTTSPNLEFFGEVGLAPAWLRRELGGDERRWVSACVFARISGPGLAQAIAIRGSHPGLHPSSAERDAWPVEEGAFYGDLFVADRPVEWIACRGRGRDAGGLLDRECAREDPARPGYTLCGFRFAGDCEAVCTRSPGHYRRCPLPGGRTSAQVITAFVTP